MPKNGKKFVVRRFTKENARNTNESNCEAITQHTIARNHTQLQSNHAIAQHTIAKQSCRTTHNCKAIDTHEMHEITHNCKAIHTHEAESL